MSLVSLGSSNAAKKTSLAAPVTVASREPLAAFGPDYVEPYGKHVERSLQRYREVAERFTPAGAALFRVEEVLFSRCVEAAIQWHDAGKLTEKWQAAAQARQGQRLPSHAALGAAAVWAALDRPDVSPDLRNACAFAVAIHHADTGLVSDVIERPDTRAVFDGLVADDGTIRWDEPALAWIDGEFSRHLHTPPSFPNGVVDLRAITIDRLYQMAKALRIWSRGADILTMQTRRLQAAFVHHLLKIADFRAASDRAEFGGENYPVVRTILHGGILPTSAPLSERAPAADGGLAGGQSRGEGFPTEGPPAVDASVGGGLAAGTSFSATPSSATFTTLYVPQTGFEDLDAKIAFGLAWLCLEADARDVTVTSAPDGLRVQAGVSAPALASALEVAAHRYLAAETLYQIPGVQAKYRQNYVTATLDESGKPVLKPIYKNPPIEIWTQFPPAVPTTGATPELAPSQARSKRRGKERAEQQKATGSVNFTKDSMCGHDVEPFGGSAGLIMAASPHAGKPYERDRAGSRPNLKLCALCGSAAVLGVHSACFRGFLGDAGGETVIITPVPMGRLSSTDITAIFAAQKTASGARLAPQLPLTVVPLVYLAQYRHIAELLTTLEARLHVALLSAGGRGSDRLGGSAVLDARPQARFVVADPFNATTVLQLIRGKLAAIEPLTVLNEALSTEEERAARQAVARFCRIYHGWSGFGVFYRTAEFLLKEVAKVDQDIRESASIRSVGRLLRYFVEQRKYNYVDSVRQARSVDDLLKELQLALREGRTRISSDDRRHDAQGQYVPLPAEEEVLDIDRLCAGDPTGSRFDQVKTALVVRALSRPSRARTEVAAADVSTSADGAVDADAIDDTTSEEDE